MIEENKQKKNKVIKGIALLGLFLMVVGISYALFRVTLNGNKTNKIKTGKMELLLTERNASVNEPEGIAINIENAIPMSDEEGKTLEDKYEFDILNKGDVNAKYEIYVDVESDSTLDPNFVKAYLELDGEAVSEPITLGSIEPDAKGGYKIETGVVAKGYRNQYTLRLFLKEETELDDVKIDEDTYKEFNAKIRVEGTQLTSVENPYRPGSAAYKIVNDNTVVDKKGSFPVLGWDPTKEATGLYRYTDKSGTTTYAYRGIVMNNYAVFAGKKWWVVRTLEDGSIKLLLQNAGEFFSLDGCISGGFRCNDPNDFNKVAYNNNRLDPNNVKFENSFMKQYVDKWYDKYLTNYDSKIAKSDYCNDMSETPDTNATNYIFTAYADEYFNVYGFLRRYESLVDYDKILAMDEEYIYTQADEDLANSKIGVSLTCREEDKVKTKIALITADEYILAGGGYERTTVNTPSYMSNVVYEWWTMTPANFTDPNADSAAGASVYKVNDWGSVSESAVNSYAMIHPVITLKPSVKVSGDGSFDSPYRFE